MLWLFLVRVLSAESVNKVHQWRIGGVKIVDDQHERLFSPLSEQPKNFFENSNANLTDAELLQLPLHLPVAGQAYARKKESVLKPLSS